MKIQIGLSWRRSLLGAAFLAVTATAVVAIALPSSAAGRGQSQVVKFGAADIPTPFKSGIAASASRSGIATSTLAEVAPAGQPTAKAGLVVGRSPTGDMVSFFTAHSFTSFRTIAAASQQQELAVGASIQPDAAGDTGHVQLLGIAAPDVTAAKLDLKNGSTIDVQLVHAGNDGYSFFTYISDDPSTFPLVAHVYDAVGVEQQQRDLTLALAPPK